MESIVRPDGGAPPLTIQAIAHMLRSLERQAPPLDRWVVTMRLGTYRALWNTRTPMRRKIARMVSSPMRPHPR